jgi:hypothetical protein
VQRSVRLIMASSISFKGGQAITAMKIRVF